MNSEENKDRIANDSDSDEWMNSVDYAVILAYLEKFGEFLFDKSIKIKTLESNLTDSNRFRRKLKNFHFKLMRRLNSGKSMKRHKLETYLSKFIDNCPDDVTRLKENGYISLPLKQKLQIIKNLLEAQFDENVKFRKFLTNEANDLSELRSKPIGRDRQGNIYWFFMDSNYTFRLFVEYADSSKWKLIAKDEDELKALIVQLSINPSENNSQISSSNSRPKRQRIIRAQETCQKCSKSLNKNLVNCIECSKSYHVSCVKSANELFDSTEWTCINCEQDHLVGSLEKRLKEVRSNRWKSLPTSDDSDSSEEVEAEDKKSTTNESSVETTVVKKIINFDSPVKEGTLRSCRLNKINYRLYEEDDNEEEKRNKRGISDDSDEYESSTTDAETETFGRISSDDESVIEIRTNKSSASVVSINSSSEDSNSYNFEHGYKSYNEDDYFEVV